MEKLELKNGEKIGIQDGASENVIQVTVESIDAFKELYNKFTEDNFSEKRIEQLGYKGGFRLAFGLLFNYELINCIVLNLVHF